MVTIEEVQTVYYMVAATGVLVAAVYYVLNMRQTIKTRQAQLFMPIYATYHSDEYLKAYSEIMKTEYSSYDDYNSRYSYEANPEANVMHRKYNGFLEGIGVLVKRGLIDPGMMDDLMSGVVVRYWEKYEPFILEYRKRNWHGAGEHVEYLYRKVKPIAERQRGDVKG